MKKIFIGFIVGVLISSTLSLLSSEFNYYSKCGDIATLSAANIERQSEGLSAFEIRDEIKKNCLNYFEVNSN